MINDSVVALNDTILVTGAAGFIGSKVVETILSYGFRNIRCFIRPSSNISNLTRIIDKYGSEKVKLIEGNLLSREDCSKACDGVTVIYNLVAGMEKSFPGCYLNSVVTLRNLLDAASQNTHLKRFLHVSSFSVYSNLKMRRRSLLDETCQMENGFMDRNDAYCFGKVKQDDLLKEYGSKNGIPYVIVRPGVPYGPGVKVPIHARIGIDTFGIFMHLGGSNKIPFTYIDNCAEAIVLAGLKTGIDNEAFNIVDDDLPTSRKYLKLYKRNIHRFKSIYIPYGIFALFCYGWEKYSKWSQEQIPAAFNVRKCAALWKGNVYSNNKLKTLVGWKQKISTEEGMKQYFEYLKKLGGRK
jgi:nucleoside-diphosphate-sugar epimerase